MGAWSYVQPRIATALRKVNGPPHELAPAARAHTARTARRGARTHSAHLYTLRTVNGPPARAHRAGPRTCTRSVHNARTRTRAQARARSRRTSHAALQRAQVTPGGPRALGNPRSARGGGVARVRRA